MYIHCCFYKCASNYRRTSKNIWWCC